MHRGLVARGEDAGALHRDVDAERLVRQLGRILDRRHLDLLAVDDQRVAVDADFVGETAVHAVEAQQVGVGLDRAEIVDRNHFNVFAAGLGDGAQHQSPDASEPVDRNLYRHRVTSS